jgi:hypothetical protein
MGGAGCINAVECLAGEKRGWIAAATISSKGYQQEERHFSA